MTTPQLGILCPICHLPDAGVTDSRPTEDAVRRRRACANGHRFTTYEIVVEGPVALLPGSGSRPFHVLPLADWAERISNALTSGVPELVRRVVR